MLPEVLPSFWNRISASSLSSTGARVVSIDDFEKQVGADIEALLNERRPRAEALPNYLRGTILDYGLRDFAGLNVRSLDGARALALAIQDSLRLFDCRLRDVTVAVPGEDTLKFEVQATLSLNTASERVRFQLTCDPESSRVKIERLHGSRYDD